MPAYLEQAQQKLQCDGYKITNARQDVLETLANSKQALTAYGIQDLLKQNCKDYQAITIYRVLDLFCELNLVHRIYSINAFVKCLPEKDHDHHHHQFLVCEKCHHIKKIENQIPCTTITRGFVVKQDIHEILGLCNSCN
jgi:Fur family zinc uptake transcriptional regulator